ncbi:MAG: NAD(P)H-hydrate dehydratase [Amylibacter sp.]|nr:NAD(P)H-hydrate dehydratase [Amylibacter sp.]
MTELLTAAQMRAIEQAAIDSGQVTGLELMERAGAGVVEAIFEEWPELAKTSHRAVVLCGPGNNGGDGFVVARLLKEWGWEVEVFLYGDEAKLPTDAKVNCERWRQMGEVESAANITGIFSEECVFIDALLGTGLARPLPDAVSAIWNEWMRLRIELDVKSVSIDIPSGICSDSGKNIGNFSFDSELVVSFHRPKIGHYIYAGGITESVTTKNIGLEQWQEHWRNNCQLVRAVDLGFDGDLPDLVKVDDHKFDNGHAYILSGPSSKTGAARLAARGALRIGAGVVTVACPPDAVAEHAAQLTAIMLTPVADAQALMAVLDDQRINAICVGPALGLAQDRAEVLATVLQAKRATVIDADGLTLLAQHSDLMGLLHDKCILTPHGGEFARVFPDIAEKLAATPTKGPAYSKVDATREAAKRAGCVVLFKGADTVIANAQGRCAINSAHYKRAAPWLATAGSGDVLAGFITGLLARGFAPMQAAETGAWLHVECALNFGPGLISEDLPEQLPEVFRKLEL